MLYCSTFFDKKETDHQNTIIIRYLGLQPYELTFFAMYNFTNRRNNTTLDEIWLVEHPAVFTQGRAGNDEHILSPGDIPIIYSDRGGQITYHGPGQLIMYVLFNLKRRNLNIRKLIILLEQAVLNTLEEFSIRAHQHPKAPGVYVNNMKICSLGLCIRKGFSLHGLALNVNMDLSPFLRINPCGYSNMRMTQMCQWVKNITSYTIRPYLVRQFLLLLNSPPYINIFHLTNKIM